MTRLTSPQNARPARPRARPRAIPAAALSALALAFLTPPASYAADPREDLMVARDCSRIEACTQTWTLTSRLGQILEDYEQRLGPAARRYRLLGIEFTSGPRPRIWYPNFGSGPKSVIIQLTQRARRDRGLALFQLAHEAFHLLNPVKPGAHTSVLEEGLASYFAARYVEDSMTKARTARLSEPAYRNAFHHVAALAARHPDFTERLRRLRELKGGFSRVSPDELRAAFPHIKAREASILASRFDNATN
jgi:hypothetical protein